MTHPITDLVRRRRAGLPGGIVSVCSAHPDVIATALAAARRAGQPALIEATCNQVNQDGGYTGMTPADFRAFVLGLAEPLGLRLDDGSLILGGDHLGPNPWRKLPADQAMERARIMVAAYATAGFSKLHLDCSMGCAGEPMALDDITVAARAANLARVAEAAVPEGAPRPVYVIGTEVPVPGGATGAHVVEVTRPEAAARTVALHREAFSEVGLSDVFESRVHGLVVQPGVEFDNSEVLRFDRPAAVGLAATLDALPGFLFEAHSTDYQSSSALAALVSDGFAILKVGPALTFALREGLYALDRIASDMGRSGPSLRETVEAAMMARPSDWEPYCHGGPAEQAIARHLGLSDRVRYYWPESAVQQAVAGLIEWLGPHDLRADLLRAHLPQLWSLVASGDLPRRAESIVPVLIRLELDGYFAATQG